MKSLGFKESLFGTWNTDDKHIRRSNRSTIFSFSLAEQDVSPFLLQLVTAYSYCNRIPSAWHCYTTSLLIGLLRRATVSFVFTAFSLTMIRRCCCSSLFVLLLSSFLTLMTTTTTMAFSVVPSRTAPLAGNSLSTTSKAKATRQGSSSTTLFLSDVPQNNNNNNKNNKKNNGFFATESFYMELPPAPENRIVLTGDLLALCVYGFLDHFLCHDCADLMVGQAHNGAQLQALLPPTTPVLTTPVWLDVQVMDVTKIWQVTVSDQVVSHYSPLLQPVGLATCLLAASWLVAGYCHKAFLYKNTLDCSTERVLEKTSLTWMTTCGIMLALMGVSQGGALHMTKGDVDFITDSLVVILSLRYFVSLLTKHMMF
jgi:hypothetical protein